MNPITFEQEQAEIEGVCYWCREDMTEDTVYMWGSGGYGVCVDHQHRYQCEMCDDLVDGQAKIFVGMDGRPRSVCAPCYAGEREWYT